MVSTELFRGLCIRSVRTRAYTAAGALCVAVGLLSAASPASAGTIEEAVGTAQGFERAGPDKMQNGLPISSFYDTPVPLPYAVPGSLIRADAQPYAGYAGNGLYGEISKLPAGVTAYRIVYHSRSSTGARVAASGVVLLPPGTPPAGGWPVIAWAHGTSGVARNCAPSAMKDLFYGDTGLYGFLNSLITSPSATEFPHYAVVATDYTGLGTNYPHEYLSRKANANDVIYSLPAARAALPDKLSSRWVVVGHSQGAEAALAVAELQGRRYLRDWNYLGAVAIAPVTYLVDTVRALKGIGTPGTAGYLPMVADAVMTRFRWVSPADLLTPLGLERSALAPLFLPAPDAAQLGCLYTASAAYSDIVNYQQVLRGEFGFGIKHPALHVFSWINQPGHNRAQQPIFIAQGKEDEVIPVALTDRAVQRLCRLGDRVLYKKYDSIPGSVYTPHTQAVYSSFDDLMLWIGGRFNGYPAPNSCRS